MSLQTVGRQGAQRPRLEQLPAGKVESSGAEVVELAAHAGLFLDPWQQWVLEEALAEREDRSWAAFEVGLVVPRQNGKGAILEALELAALFLFKERLIVHSAHEFKTASEHFRRVRGLISGCPDLDRKVLRTLTGNQNPSIETVDGNRLLFVARSRGSARGFTADRLVLDEAMILSVDAMGAMLPALSTVPNPQVWYTSSAPHADSLVLHKVRERAMRATSDRLFYAEWGNPDGDGKDWDAIASANPGLGYRIDEEFIDVEYEAIGHLGDEFARERLGVAAAMDAGEQVFGPGRWPACADPKSQTDVARVALDVSVGMQWASFAAAGPRTDHLIHLELIDRRPGTGWVVDRAKDLAARWGPILIDPKSPAGGIVADLEEAAVPVELLEPGDMPKACSALQNAVMNGSIRHLAQPPLDAAVAGASVRPSGDTWTWARKTALVDLSPLVAVTLACWSVRRPVPVTPTPGYLSLSEV